MKAIQSTVLAAGSTACSRGTTAAIKLSIMLLAIWSPILHLQAQGNSPTVGATNEVAALQAAADQGDAVAEYRLGRHYFARTGSLPNYPKAIEYFQKAAAQGNAEAEIMLGAAYGQGRGVPRNLANAVAWYRKAADQGNALAEYSMGNFYSSGRGVTNDMAQAIQWWKKAADQKQADAEAALGELYLSPSPQHGNAYVNYSEAVQYLRRGAEHGSVAAMNNLGVACEGGYGVAADFKEAAKWYRMAAELGDPDGQGNLGMVYFMGKGVPIDLVEAYKWFKLSAMGNGKFGNWGLAQYAEHPDFLTPDQIATAEKWVRAFRPTSAAGNL